MNILGISAFYHDSAACLVRDGEIIAAAQEERFTRKKYDSSFPVNSIMYCLKEGEISAGDIDIVSFYNKPRSIFERMRIKRLIKRHMAFEGKVIFVEHHLSHAASAFFPSPFQKAAIMVIDDAADGVATSYGTGRGNLIRMKAESRFPNSLGLFYSVMTSHVGFKPNSEEYMAMGLASYGRPVYKQLILKELVDLKEDGSFALNKKYFNYTSGLLTANKRFDKLFGPGVRDAGAKPEKNHIDFARSVQEVTEEIILRLSRRVQKETGQSYLCLAGEVALNCVANGRLLREGPFEDIWIQPASGEAGCSLGAALFTWHEYLGNRRESDGIHDSMKGACLGPRFDGEYIESFLKNQGILYERLEYADIAERAADFINAQKVVGWFEGRMEFGPRALGGRSIIADARSSKMSETMNDKIKFRESFRPFAPAVLAESVGDYVTMEKKSPYMLFTAPVKQSNGHAAIPGATHVDGSARVQTVEKYVNGIFYDMINKVKEKYGCGAVMNTSFNTGGEPMVCGPEDAYRCFADTDIDCLFMENFLLEKKAS